MKLRIKGSLFHCGRCGRSHSNPLGHVCVTRLDRRERKGGTTLAPKLAVAAASKCGRCGKPLGNPLTHTCVTADFKQRKADFRQRQAAARKAARPAHRYEECRDEDCQRTACAAYRQGSEEGHAAGYEQGFPDGIAACPRKHG